MTSDLEHKHGYCPSPSVKGEASTTSTSETVQIGATFPSFLGVSTKYPPVQTCNNSDHTVKNTSSSSSSSSEAATTVAALKLVSFAETVTVRRTLSRDSYTEEERLAYWFTEKDFARMKRSSMALVVKMNSCSPSSTTKYCTRGLERYSQVQGRHRLKNRYDSIFAVLEEQDNLYDEGFSVDDERISKVYSSHTYTSILWAHLVGLQDQKEAEKYKQQKPRRTDS
ncbi:hypothetical protein IV203_032237 [Nitzschia inconspicua]|uniref:Uncharacterized protein n=1 Tax=Nitzschia inconspicua TaxID=303405 RepID=A0A9K3KJQ4_9STRA|nr:hypothetical protein IV203_032237 [Nitzschia inconspicua]